MFDYIHHLQDNGFNKINNKPYLSDFLSITHIFFKIDNNLLEIINIIKCKTIMHIMIF